MFFRRGSDLRNAILSCDFYWIGVSKILDLSSKQLPNEVLGLSPTSSLAHFGMNLTSSFSGKKVIGN